MIVGGQRLKKRTVAESRREEGDSVQMRGGVADIVIIRGINVRSQDGPKNRI